MGFQDFENFRSRHPAIRTTGLLTFTLAGLSPAEHTSVFTGRNSRMSLYPSFSAEVSAQHGHSCCAAHK